MNELKHRESNYNYNTRTMVRLCEISYQDMSTIPGSVKDLGLNVVWGPAEAVSSWGISYSLMFVAMRRETNEYTVVIRGTNMYSWESWTKQDFDIDKTVPFNKLAPHAPANALISEGTFNGMNDLIGLSDPTTGKGVLNFLKNAKPRHLFVTGHSLGGTLTPPMFAYLNDLLYEGGKVHNMNLWSFAGLTPGDGGFNSYFRSLLREYHVNWRFHNTLDIAPFCWWSLDDIRNIYAPYDLSLKWWMDAAFTYLFTEAAGKGYAQPIGGKALPGKFDSSISGDYPWVDQALHQHHASTYKTLVDEAYPYSGS